MHILMRLRMLLPATTSADAYATPTPYSYPDAHSYAYTIVQWVARLRRYSKMLARPGRYVSLLLPGHGHLTMLLRQELYAHPDRQRLAQPLIGSEHAAGPGGI